MKRTLAALFGQPGPWFFLSIREDFIEASPAWPTPSPPGPFFLSIREDFIEATLWSMFKACQLEFFLSIREDFIEAFSLGNQIAT